MRSDFFPRRDADLAIFTTNFSEQLASKATQVGLLASDATLFAGLNSAWISALNIAKEPVTRTKPTIATKDEARAAVVAKLREYAARIQKFGGTTDTLRADFGLPIPKQRTPIPVPQEIPQIEIKRRVGTSIVLRLSEATGRRTKPAGVQSARIFTYVGPMVPTDPDLWKTEGVSSKTEIEIDFPSTLAPGTTVWITAAWSNPRGQLGIAAAPISTTIAGGGISMAA
jgi:hypothetical protein